MTLSELSSIVGVISGLAVLGSLVYLAQQTRQNSKHTQALIQQSRSMQTADMLLRCKIAFNIDPANEITHRVDFIWRAENIGLRLSLATATPVKAPICPRYQ